MEKVKVIVRMRPLNTNEKKLKSKNAWNLDLETDTISSKDETHYKSTFVYDALIPASIKTSKVYRDNCKNLIARALDGIDTTIFVYG